ncbi:MAG: hypothetical protein GWN00_02925, partial [Aliifodinibius sp.]|nr:hypothetical protein [Fodinibius sp.]NIW43570.1 hypothetical protein [Gammaproteobacteria bacterium]NIW96767.1 hypothetical protein [Phycisphaerae bacterium]NIY23807.1 hypothetical protein [Fodinibius sp.]
ALQLAINNNGDETLDVYFHINKGASNTLAVDSIIGLPPNQITTRTYPDTASLVSTTLIYTASIDSARSQISGQVVNAGQAPDNSESVEVQAPARLALNALPDVQLIISKNDTFTVQYSVERFGESNFDPGSVRIDLPTGPGIPYQLLSPDTVKSIEMNNLTGSWQVRADSLTDTLNTATFDSIRVRFESLPADINISAPVIVSAGDSSDIVEVRTAQLGDINTIVTIASPPGAQDMVLSTGQTFTIRNSISFSDQIATTNREININLPPGFSGPNNIALPDTGNSFTETWPVIAPSDTINAAKIVVETSGFDKNSGTLIIETDTLTVDVVNRAEVRPFAEVVLPSGARDGTISTYQEFTVSVSVQPTNTSQAQTIGNNQVRMVLPSGFAFVDSADTVVTLVTGDSTDIRLRSPQPAVPLPNPLSRQLRAVLEQAANDENTDT